MTEIYFDEVFGNVAELERPLGGALRVGGVVRKKTVVVFEVRAASRGVGDDRVVPGKIDGIELSAGQGCGEAEFTVVGVERAAAGLSAGCVNLAVVGEEDVGG